MSAAKYREVREKTLGLTREQMAEALGVVPRTIANREYAVTAINQESRLALKFLVLEQLYDLTGVIEW